jgi:hypothetical protein
MILVGINQDAHKPKHQSTSNKKLGARVMTVTGDVIEVKITKPPKTVDEAADFATTHYLWANDVVTQGTESMPDLANETLSSGTAFLWWD